MSKHSKMFYRAVARIRAINEKNGVVFLDRLRTKFKIGPVRTIRLWEELIKAGVLRRWEKSDFRVPKSKRGKGNILWENMGKFRVPKEITIEESIRVKDEFKKGLLPKTVGELFK